MDLNEPMSAKVKIDVIILSYAKDDSLRNITTQTIETLLLSEDPEKIEFNVLIIESNRQLEPFQYPGTKTIYPQEPFGYNKFMNIGINMTDNLYVCLCNNDLIFRNGWATEMLKAFNQNPELQSANPYCDGFIYAESIAKSTEKILYRHNNVDVIGALTGWCIFVRRSIFEVIGLLDERFEFWYADNDYDMTLRQHMLVHALIKESKVSHLGCVSHDTLEGRKDEMTTGQRKIFEKKWMKKSLFNRLISAIRNG